MTSSLKQRGCQCSLFRTMTGRHDAAFLRRALFAVTIATMAVVSLLTTGSGAVAASRGSATNTAGFAVFSGTPGDSDVITSVALNARNGDVFIGGKNYIWQMDAGLSGVRQLQRGRVNDSLTCGPPPDLVCSGSAQHQDRDNFILLLHPDPAGGRLIACGNVYGGVCEVLNLADIKSDLSATTGGFYPKQGGFVVPPVLTNPSLVTSSMSADLGTMFVATPSFSEDGVLNPVVRSLSLKTLELQAQHSEIRIQNSGAEFPSGWIASFLADGYVYFVYRQDIVGKLAKPSTTLVRLCARDQGYKNPLFFYQGYGSYVEMPFGYFDKTNAPTGSFAQAVTQTLAGGHLATNISSASSLSSTPSPAGQGDESGGNGASVVVAAFDATVGGGSLIGVLSLNDVNGRMTQREIDCANFTGQAGTSDVGSVRLTKCVGFVTENASTAICGQPVHAPLAVPKYSMDHSSLVLALPSKFRVRSLVAASYGRHTVVFAGTEMGHVIKILVNKLGRSTASVYDDIEVDMQKRPIVKLLLSPNKTELYALANVSGSASTPSSELIKVPVHGCERFTTCSECTSPRSVAGRPVVNPLCGWCTYTGECTARQACQAPAQSSRPFHQNSSLCPVIVSVTPNLLPSQTEQQISIEVVNLPPSPPGGSLYHCDFGSGRRRVTKYDPSTGRYSCVTPKLNITEALVDVSFGLYLPATDAVFLQFSGVQGFNCLAHTRCGDCLRTVAPCGWCMYDNVCTVSSASCKQDSNAWSTIPAGETPTDVCPTFTQAHDIQHVNVFREFILTARNLPVPRQGTNDRYQCALLSANSTIDVVMATQQRRRDASVSTMTCSDTFSAALLNSTVGMIEKRLVLLWNGVDISGPQASLVTFYSCQLLAQGDCSLCIAQASLPQRYPADKKFQCQWCSTAAECSPRSAPSCFKDSQKCPDPVVKKIIPSSGPLSGGTLVEITGSNLGARREDVSEVRIDGALCDIRRYSPAQKLWCKTSAKLSTNWLPGDVHVSLYKNTRRSRHTSDVTFKYTVPSFTDVYPRKSPKSGGTLVMLTGIDFDTGRDVEIHIAGVKCTLAGESCLRPSSLCNIQPMVARNNTHMWCYTSAYPQAVGAAGSAIGLITMAIDGFDVQVKNIPFSYFRDPVVSANGISTTRGILSGGVEVMVRGNHFNSVGEIAIMISEDGLENTTVCQSFDNTVARCVLPAFARTTPYASVLLVCDGRQLLIKRNFPIVDDPVIVEQQREATGDLLELEGMNFDNVNKEAFKVYVGDLLSPASLCNISSVDSNNLICRLPPSFRDVSNPVTARITVQIGTNLRYSSTVVVSHPQQQQRPISGSSVTNIAGGVAGGAAFLLLIFLLLFLYCQQRARTAEGEVLRMITRMETLESTVAMECKSAFTDLMTDLGDHGISTADDNLPYLSFYQYAMRSTFPATASDQHPHLLPLAQRLKHLGPSRLEHTRKTLITFQRALVYNKKFLVTFVHALEPHFGMKDRVAFASLLMVALHDKMEYATDVLKSLLADLIKSSVQKSHPELLFRRMQTVAEKMLSIWMTLSLHDYLRSVAGRPLYMLFRAVKAQTERGPIDAVSGEARYSLSEEKLLREAVQYQELSCCFERDSGQLLTVRLQDCDTVTQAKEKIMDAIYKTAPVSTRPDLSSVDLAMEVEGSPPLILRDDDMTTVQEGNTRKINTLRSYDVSKDARFRFVKRSLPSGKSEKSTDYLGAMTFSSPHWPRPAADDGVRLYHLAKPNEYDVPVDKQSYKMVHEVFLTRLLFTKNVLQRFVDDLFCKVFSTGSGSSSSRSSPHAPEAVKYLFDFLDQQAAENGIDDPNVIHSWKNNSVPLRFWINIIKNPDFVFDIHKTATVDSSLSVVAQMFMDSCGNTDQRLSKESPTTKLLYAREVETYRRLVQKYYADIQAMPVILEGRMHDILQQTSVGPDHGGFQKDSAMYDVFIYGLHNRDSVASALKAEGLLELMRQFESICDELAHGFDQHSSAV